MPGPNHQFKYAVDRRYLPVLLPLGFRRSNGVTVAGGGDLTATFGFLTVRTNLENIDGAHITRDYRWWTAVGARRSFVDDGLTFGTNFKAGVCIHFREKVPSALSRKGHSALTVTVEDLDGLVEALSR